MMSYAMHKAHSAQYMKFEQKKAFFRIYRRVRKTYIGLMCRLDDNWSDSHLDQSRVKEQLNRPIQSINWTIVMKES